MVLDPMNVDFAKNGGLVPAIVQHALTGAVLMLGYMNRAALEKTLAEGVVTFYSRSKQRLWIKGESSGHFLQLDSIAADCDRDALLIQAVPIGPVCHLGKATCFGEQAKSGGVLAGLEALIETRATADPDKSYTARLMHEGIARCAQKVGEEAVETALAAVSGDDKALCSEATDLLYHLLVLLAARHLPLAEVYAELAARRR